MEFWEVIVVGGGAAGLMAAARAAERGRRVLLLEKKRRPGTKILMSGGSRCNLTHAIDARGMAEAFGRQGPFLRSALAALGPEQLVALVEAEGVPTKVEPTGKIFPVSDRAEDVLAALLARLRRSGCELAADEAVEAVDRDEDRGRQVFRVDTAQRTLAAEKLVLTTGGQSYPSSGSTGDGYRWAAELGHTIVPLRPALVPIASPAAWVRELQGITLADVRARVVQRESRSIAERRASLLFTHFGVSGPAALDVSGAVSGHARPSELILSCDLVPDERPQALEAALQDDCRTAGRRLAAGLLTRYVPQRVAETITALAGVDPQRRAAEVTRQERQAMVARLKQLEIPVGGTLGFNKAEVTAGGVALDEVDSRSMQSKLVPGLYFAGEILDIDGPIGGYNFQAAFSTGWLAGESL